MTVGLFRVADSGLTLGVILGITLQNHNQNRARFGGQSRRISSRAASILVRSWKIVILARHLAPQVGST
jgi:hypothetical protein